MKLLNKMKIISLLEEKVKNKEIVSYKLTDTQLILRNKSVNFKLDRSNFSDKELIKILYRKIPIDMKQHFKMETRNVKLRILMNCK